MMLEGGQIRKEKSKVTPVDVPRPLMGKSTDENV